MARRKKQPEQTPEKRSAGDWAEAFLAALSNSANVRYACQQAGIGRQTAYDRKRDDAEFSKRWKVALADACDNLEALAWARAKSESDTLLIFLLKAHRPKKYRENFRHEHTGADGGPIQVTAIEVVKPEAIADGSAATVSGAES